MAQAPLLMDDIKTIVDLLNEPPFNERLSLVTFDEKTPSQLLQIVSNVFHEIDNKHPKEMRDDPNFNNVLLEFIAMLNYKHNMEPAKFREAFVAGDTTVIYPILLWCLKRLKELQTRAYLAQYLRPFEVPEEMFAEEAMVENYQKYKELQQEFKEVHKSYEKQRQGRQSPDELQKHLDKLAKEKEQLGVKLMRLRQKADSEVENRKAKFQELLTVTSALRKEQEEQGRLYDKLRDQEQALGSSDQKRRQLAARLSELSVTDTTTNPHLLLEKLREEVQVNSFLCKEKLEREVADRQQKLQDMQQVVDGEPMTEQEVEGLQLEVETIKEQITELQAQQQKLMASVDDKLPFYKNPAQAAEKKKEQLLSKLAELEEDKQELDEENRGMDQQLSALQATGKKPMSTEELKQYMKNLAAKTTQYKDKKAYLQELTNDMSVLIRTEEILKSRDKNLKEYLEELEKKKGVSGFAAAQDKLEAVSSTKGQVDSTKGQTLDELSRVVGEITSKLADNKQKIAPKIKELRVARTKVAELETDYQAKKKVYDSAAAGISSEKLKLEQEVAANTQEVSQQESKFHLIQAMKRITEANLAKLAEENKYRSGQGSLSEENKTYESLYEGLIKEYEASAKRLREEQKEAKDNHAANLVQREGFTALQQLLQIKLKLAQEQAQQAQQDNAEHDFMKIE